MPFMLYWHADKLSKIGCVKTTQVNSFQVGTPNGHVLRRRGVVQLARTGRQALLT